MRWTSRLIVKRNKLSEELTQFSSNQKSCGGFGRGQNSGGSEETEQWRLRRRWISGGLTLELELEWNIKFQPLSTTSISHKRRLVERERETMMRFRSVLKKLRLKQKGKEKLRLKQKEKPECYQDPDLKRFRSDLKTPRLDDVNYPKRPQLGDVDGSSPNPNPNPDPDDEEKLRLKQKEMDAIDAAEFADFCQFIDENITVDTNDTYPDDTVDIKQRELEEQLEELEVLEVFEKIRNGTLSNNAGYCPVCKKKNYNCDHYHYDKRWKSYSLISCFICRSQGEHWATGCPYSHDKSVHPLWGRRY